METWCDAHREAYCDSTQQLDRTMELMAALGDDPKYREARGAYVSATGSERDALQSEATKKFTPVCCYLGDARIREVFGIDVQ